MNLNLKFESQFRRVSGEPQGKEASCVFRCWSLWARPARYLPARGSFCGLSVFSPLSFFCTSTTRSSVAAVVVLCRSRLTVRVCFDVPKAKRARTAALCTPWIVTWTQRPTSSSVEIYLYQIICGANQAMIHRTNGLVVIKASVMRDPMN